MTFTGLLVGVIAGQLAARRLPGSGEAWAASAGIALGAMGALFVAVAIIVHVLHVPRWLATALALVVLVAQGFAIAGRIPGPGDSIGSFALWGMRVHAVDIIGIAVVVVLGVLAVLLAGRLRVEPLVRRGDLVSQLRFAVTMQDLRTVVLLRRQLRGEQPRPRPWVRLAPTLTGTPRRAIWQRGWRGLLRYPISRIARMAGLAVLAGFSAVAVLRGTTPAIIGVGLALYLLGLDAVEPLSQEIDHPDHTDGVPLDRGWMMAHHIAAPAVALVPFAVVGALGVIVFEPQYWWGALALCLPCTWVGVGGGVVSIVRDAPDPLAPPTAASAAVPPEFAGFTSTFRLIYPMLVSVVAGLPLLAVRQQPDVGTVVRMVVAMSIVAIAIAFWVRKRDDWRVKFREFMDAGRAAGKATA
jgi:hypothetical protein